MLITQNVRAYALSPSRPRPLPKVPELPYSENEINIIVNTVNGEVGGITGTAILTYADGTTVEVDSSILRRIHARVVDNQVKSDMFPNAVKTCVSWYWSSSYTYVSSTKSDQWERCYIDVLYALYWKDDVPRTVLAATCDPYFANRYTMYTLWAKVTWNTGWTYGTFYYYALREE